MKRFILKLFLISAFGLQPFGLAFSQNLNWPDPVANHVVPYQSLGITHGPLLGGVGSSSIKVWIRTQEAADFQVLVSESLPFEGALATTGKTNQDTDFTGWVEVTGLKPNTRYYYAVVVRGEIVDTRFEATQPWPTFRTLPDSTSYTHEFNPDGKFNFSFSVGACQRQRSPKDSYGIYADPPVFNTLWEKHRDRLAFHIINGDYTYEEVINLQHAA